MSKRAFLAGLALLPGGAVSNAAAETYLTRPITVTVPLSAGGPTELVARLLREDIGWILRRQMVIGYVSAAGGITGVTRVVTRRPTATQSGSARSCTYRPFRNQPQTTPK